MTATERTCGAAQQGSTVRSEARYKPRSAAWVVEGTAAIRLLPMRAGRGLRGAAHGGARGLSVVQRRPCVRGGHAAPVRRGGAPPPAPRAPPSPRPPGGPPWGGWGPPRAPRAGGGEEARRSKKAAGAAHDA